MAQNERYLNAKGSEMLFKSPKFAGLPVVFDDKNIVEKGGKRMITRVKVIKGNQELGGYVTEDALAYFSTDDQIAKAEKAFLTQYYGGNPPPGNNMDEDEEENDDYYENDDEDEEEDEDQ